MKSQGIPSPFSIEHLTSLGSVNEHRWGEVADPGDLYQSYAWLRALESSDDAALTYLIARRPDRSKILGALPMFASPTTRGDHRYWPELHFQDLLRGPALLGDRLGLLAGSCAGFRTQLILDRSLPDLARIEVLRSLLDAAAGVALDRGLAYVFFLFLDASARKDLSEAAYGRVHSRLAGAAQTELELPGTGFDGYLASLKRNVRTSVRRETALYRESCSTEIIPLREAIPAVAPLVADVRAKHGMAHNVDVVSRRLQAYHCALGDDSSKAVVCRAEGHIIGAGVLCRWRDRLHVTDFGRRDGAARDPFIYFNTTIYEPIKYAYAMGLSRVVTGAGTEFAKAQRGSAILPLTHLAMAAGGHANLPADDMAGAADLRDHWRTQRGLHPGHFGPLWDEFL